MVCLLLLMTVSGLSIYCYNYIFRVEDLSMGWWHTRSNASILRSRVYHFGHRKIEISIPVYESSKSRLDFASQVDIGCCVPAPQSSPLYLRFVFEAIFDDRYLGSVCAI